VQLGLISDIHADPLGFELALRQLRAHRVDRVVCAGDLVGHGPFPDRVVALMIEHRIASARGNHDRWAVAAGPCGTLPFGGAPCAAASIEYLEKLPSRLPIAGHDRLGLVTHASPESDMLGILPDEWSITDLDRLLSELGVDFLVVGHTHRPGWHRSPTGLVVNPGSLATIPNVPSSRTFAILELPALEVVFRDVETGEKREVPPWHEARPSRSATS
jgi:putative phosphoesterase